MKRKLKVVKIADDVIKERSDWDEQTVKFLKELAVVVDKEKERKTFRDLFIKAG